MVRGYEGWDVEGSGRRYTWRVALALPTGEPDMHEAERSDAGVVAERIIRDVLGDSPGLDAGLGDVEAVDGSLGRGAAGWVAVAEWAGLAFSAGIIGGAGWTTAKAAGGWLQDKIHELRDKGQRVIVSRGAAVLLAVHYVLGETQETGPLGVEAVEDPISMTGDPPSEIGYAGIEPWIVLLVNAELTKRYVVVVSAAGEPLSWMEAPMGEHERTYSQLGPPRTTDE